jgi:hypothetical protein
MARDGQRARCVHCRSEISVPDSYAQGDHVKCNSCGTRHKVVRGDTLRLVIADIAPLQDALQANRTTVARLEDELLRARGSFGISANGLGIAVIYIIYQLTHEHALNGVLFVKAGLLALVAGAVLEAANYFFFAKRAAIIRLSSEVEEARAEGRELMQRIREAKRV